MKLSAHGLEIEAPAGWEARIFRRAGAAPVLHAATFRLAESDGDFAAAATGRMRSDDAFIALVEYQRDGVVAPGHGLFSPPARRALRVLDFAAAQLQVTRRGQLGCQRFFSDKDRAFCLYTVIQPVGRRPERLVRDLNRVLATLRIAG